MEGNATNAMGRPRTAAAPARGRWRRSAGWAGPLLLLLPTLVLAAIFVYVFIGITFWVSISNWNSLVPDLSIREPLGSTYGSMLSSFRFQADIRNTVVFTVLFLALALAGGLFLAILVHNVGRSGALFRTVFIFPYSLSFIVTGVVWRWLFTPETGVNLLFNALGINAVLEKFGVGPLQPGWLTDSNVVLSVNGVLERIFPIGKVVQVELGIPVALVAVVIAAAWQLMGFAMAMYLAGLGAVPEELFEAASMDGAGWFQTYRRIIIPLLWPVTVTIVVILGHVSLKIFDLVYAMAGSGPNFVTDVPGIYVYEQMFRATQYNLGAAASVFMFVLVCLVIVPYLARTYGRE
jgi:glucose/mannose transport system permease protein